MFYRLLVYGCMETKQIYLAAFKFKTVKWKAEAYNVYKYLKQHA